MIVVRSVRELPPALLPAVALALSAQVDGGQHDARPVLEEALRLYALAAEGMMERRK